MEELFAREVMALTDRLSDLAQSHRRACDLTRWELQESLVSVTACLPIYRTYIRNFIIGDSDRAYIEAAIRDAECNSPCGGMEFLRDVLLLEPPPYLADKRPDYLEL